MAPNMKVLVTVDKAKVPSTLTNHTVLYTEDNLPPEMFDADGPNPAKNGGGDIRAWADVDCTIPRAREVKTFIIDNDPANGVAQIHVIHSSLPSGTDPECYFTWADSAASEPAADSAYGSEAAWHTDKTGVYHLEEVGDGTTDEYLDSTATGAHGTGGDGNSAKTPAQTTGAIVKGQDFDGVDDFINCGLTQEITTEDYTLQFIVNPDTLTDTGTTDEQPVFLFKGTYNVGQYFVQYQQNGTVGIWTHSASANQQTRTNFSFITTGSSQLIHVTRIGTGGSNISIYNNGTEASSYESRGRHLDMVSSGEDFEIGRYPTITSKYHVNGMMDEVRITLRGFSDDEITTEYNNLMDTANFSSAGTPINGGNGDNAILFGANF